MPAQDANLWDLTTAPTIVMTQSGARKAFQDMLRARGVEVVQFDFLTPDAVAAYCHDRGFLQCLWECGGTLAAPAIASRVIHKAMAFVAPKLVGFLCSMSAGPVAEETMNSPFCWLTELVRLSSAAAGCAFAAELPAYGLNSVRQICIFRGLSPIEIVTI